MWHSGDGKFWAVLRRKDFAELLQDVYARQRDSPARAAFCSNSFAPPLSNNPNKDGHIAPSNVERCLCLEVSIPQLLQSTPGRSEPLQEKQRVLHSFKRSELMLQVSKINEGISNQMLKILLDTLLQRPTQACFNAYRYWDNFSFPALADDNQFKKTQDKKLLKASAGFNYTILCCTKSIEEKQWYLNLCLSLLAEE